MVRKCPRCNTELTVSHPSQDENIEWSPETEYYCECCGFKDDM